MLRGTGYLPTEIGGTYLLKVATYYVLFHREPGLRICTVRGTGYLPTEIPCLNIQTYGLAGFEVLSASRASIHSTHGTFRVASEEADT